jgi:hypothetical protein
MFNFKQSIKLVIAISTIALGMPAVAAPQIANGIYVSDYPANYGIEIKNGSYVIFYDGDTPSEPAKPIPEKVLKSVVTGVFYSKANKKYYCLFNDAIEQRMVEGKLFVCAASGWIKE